MSKIIEDPNELKIDPDEEKIRGNSFFEKKNYKDAIDCFSNSILQGEKLKNSYQNFYNKKISIYFSNRANCYIKLSKNKEALNDIDEAIRLNPSYNKFYFQRAQANINLKNFQKAKDELYSLFTKFPEKKSDIDILIKIADDGILAQKPYKPDQKLSSWSNSLSLNDQYIWLIDCYRMRQDDNYVWKKEYTGIQAQETDIEILKCFILFCKLAKVKKIIPIFWVWKDFINFAQETIKYVFKKSDAKEKYGGENVFSAKMLGGRSLRYTAEMIYGNGISGNLENHDENEILLTDKIEKEIDKMKINSFRDFKNYENFFTEIGGTEIWVNFKFK